MSDFLNYDSIPAVVAAITGVVVSATLVYMFSRPPKPRIPKVDINNQSIEVPNGNGARQNCTVPPGTFYSGDSDSDVKTLLDVMQKGLDLSKDGRCLGWREQNSGYHWLTYSEVITKSRNLASGLVNIGMKPGQSTFIGIYSRNCVEFVLTEQACYNQSVISVPVYDTLGPQVCSYIINQADISIVVCDTEDKIRNLVSKAHETPNLKQIIAIKSFSDETKELAERANLKLHAFKDIETIGKENPVPTTPCKSEDLCLIFYTSGSTGNPKGVMLTHDNLMANVKAVDFHLAEYAPLHSEVFLSFLPLAHVAEKFSQTLVYYSGGAVGFYSGDIKLLLEDAKILKPTVFAIVPRVANRLYDKVLSEVKKSRLKSFLFNLAMRRKEAEIKRFIIRKDSIWDKLVFKKIRDTLGGRIKVMSCGSAVLSPDVMNFMRCAMGCVVLEIYGSTECLATLTNCGDYTVGHVGPPLPCTHIKLVDVPDMNYFANKGYGEICVKGPNGFKGYLKDPEKTAETIDSEGWIHTGDIGKWTNNGTLQIIDRKKSIFKLAQGEYIAPEKIEIIYRRSVYVSQIFVHGESIESYLIAIIVPEQETVELYCRENNIKGSWEEICQNDKVKEVILKDITKEGKKAGLKSFEQAKKIYLYPGQFSLESGLLTPTLKLKRHECCKYFKQQIITMYQLPI